MKRILFIPAIAFSLLMGSCAEQGTAQVQSLNASEFSEKIKESPNAPIIDVRSPQEFAGGHLTNAENIDWNGNSFDEKTANLDKEKPVFVYCLSGGRSSAAAAHLQEKGFKHVYEMQGGMMKWRAAQLPETKDNKISRATQMTKAQYDALLQSDKTVLIDFYADWCKPCKMMKPYLDEIATEMKDQVVVIRINADENPDICKELSVEALPSIFIYKKQKMMWYNVGYLEKSELVKHL